MNEFLESWLKQTGRVVIFSGVFDPVHKGHISIAKKASYSNGRRVVFLPERMPTHKHGSTKFEHRAAMLRLAAADTPLFAVWESPFMHHTVANTLPWIQKQFPEGQNFGLLFGTDVADHITQWPDIEKLSEFGVDQLIIADRATASVFDIADIKIPAVAIKILRAGNNHMASSVIRREFATRHTSIPKSALEYAKKHKLYN